MDREEVLTRLKERDDVEAVTVVDSDHGGSVYAWQNTNIGFSGDFNPGLLGLLQEFAGAGHGVFIPAWSANKLSKNGEPPDIQVNIDWRD